jgi:hypothetical protein
VPFASDLPSAQDALDVIRDSIMNQPRSLQKRIGPSELGAECQHCLACKVAGVEQIPEKKIPWASYVGTACHEAFAEIFETTTKDTGRWESEKRVTVGRVGGTPISGTCDLFDIKTGTVLDFKFLGTASLRAAKAKPKAVYRTQVHLYGKGWENAGHKVRNVALMMFPRTAATVQDTLIWHEPYQPEIAEQALARANELHASLTALEQISTEMRDAWIRDLPRADGCFDCARYSDYPHPHQNAALDLSGLAVA